MTLPASEDRSMSFSQFQFLISLFFTSSVVWLSWISPVLATIYQGTPASYQQYLPLLKPGDTLVLQAGVYDDPRRPPGLPIFDLHGTADAPIVITGPEAGPPAILTGRSTHNTIRFDRASYIVIRNMEVDGRDLGGDGVKAQGVAHHITLEQVFIHGVGKDQNVVGISTTGGTTWNWIIRGCVIHSAGTGMYLGNSDGTRPFIEGLIEHNVFQDSIGYNVQIKHQVKHPTFPELLSAPHATTIRHNIFQKSENSGLGSQGRPNLLIGHVPVSGPGEDDQYYIYGNVFYLNPSGEPLLQAEGNVAVYHNLLFNPYGAGIMIVPHNYRPRKVFVFQNTVVARGRGILVKGAEQGFPQVVAANAVFAGSPIKADVAVGNFTDGFSAASAFLMHPYEELGKWDLFPKERLKPQVKNFEPQWSKGLPHVTVDFNGLPTTNQVVGAYNGVGKNPGWIPQLNPKPMVHSDVPAAPSQFTLE